MTTCSCIKNLNSEIFHICHFKNIINNLKKKKKRKHGSAFCYILTHCSLTFLVSFILTWWTTRSFKWNILIHLSILHTFIRPTVQNAGSRTPHGRCLALSTWGCEAATMHAWSFDFGKGQKGIQQTNELFMSAMHVTWNVLVLHPYSRNLLSEMSWVNHLLVYNLISWRLLIYWYGQLWLRNTEDYTIRYDDTIFMNCQH